MTEPNLSGFFDQYYIFGDSLSDVNNFIGLDSEGPIPRLDLYKDGRFTNGLEDQGVWVDHFTSELNIELNSFYQGGIREREVTIADGINFALGADTSGSKNISPLGQAIPELGLSNQTNQFVNLVETGVIESLTDSLAINWIGANDYLDVALSDPDSVDTAEEVTEFATEVVDNITNSVSTVLDLGTEVVAVINMLDIGLTPLAIANDVSELTTNLSVTHNQILSESLDSLRETYPDARIIEVDIYDYFNQITNDFENITEATTSTNLYPAPITPVNFDPKLFPDGTLEDYEAANAEAENDLWWDSVHPSTRAHELIDKYITEKITSELAITGTNGDDFLAGNNFRDQIFGLKGDDTLTGGGGDDNIYGDKGDDVLLGDSGQDLLKGDKGDDQLIGGAGDDLLRGGSHDDYLSGDAGDDFLGGDGGDDILYGGSGNDTLKGGSGDDQLFGVEGNNLFIASSGDDSIYGSDGEDTVRYRQDSLEFQFEGSPNFLTVSHEDFGVQTLFNVDFIKFSNGEFTVSELLS